VVLIDRHEDNQEYPVYAFSDNNKLWCYTKLGKFFGRGKHDLDLIERIDTEPEPAPQPTAMTYEQGERIIKRLDDICDGIVILMQQGDKK